MAKDSNMPGRIRTASGVILVPVLFKIMTKDEQDRPEEVLLIPDDRVVELTGGEEFFTAYMDQAFLEK